MNLKRLIVGSLLAGALGAATSGFGVATASADSFPPPPPGPGGPPPPGGFPPPGGPFGGPPPPP
jgi:hypothetical protein